MKRRTYCTLFNMAYAAKGLAMMESLQRHSSRPIRVFVLAMDEATYAFLDGVRLPYVWPVYPYELMRGELLTKCFARNIAYRCFTCTPSLIEFAMLKSGKSDVTYLDSDLYFFSNPEHAFAEMGKREVAVVPHRFPAHDAERLAPSGQFNVSWVTFRPTIDACSLLARWRDQVLQKCDAETCGDQRYLDEWPGLLGDKLHVFQSIGLGPGPWNLYTYKITDGPELDGVPLIFWHAHEHWRNRQRLRTGYPLTKEAITYVYEPYEAALERLCHEHQGIQPVAG